MRPIDENPKREDEQADPGRNFLKVLRCFHCRFGWFLRFGIWPFIGRLTVRYRVQMIFGIRVSGFEKKVKKLFRRRCWRFSNMRSLELKSLVAAAKRPVGKGRDDKCLVRSRSRVTGVALEWHQLRYLILEARRPMRESASPKLDASR